MNLSQRVAFNTILLTASRVAVTVAGVVGVVVSTRYLGRNAFGQLTTGIVFVTLFGFLTDVGLWTVSAREIARRPDDEEAILGNVFTVGFGLSVLAIVAALAIMLVAYAGADHRLVRVAVVILAAQMLVTAFGGASTTYMTAHQLAVPAAIGSGLASLSFFACLGLVVALDVGFAGVAAAYALVGIVNVVVPFALVARRTRVRPRFDRALQRTLLRAAVPQGLLLGAGIVYFRVDTVLLSLLSSNAEVGVYGLAYRVIEALTIVPVYIMTTLFPELARAEPHSERLRDLVQGAWSTISLLAVPVLFLLVGLAPGIVAVVGGRGFAAAGLVLELLAVALVAGFLNAIFFHALVAHGRQAPLLRALLIGLAVNVVLNLVLIPVVGAVGAAIALVVSDSLLVVLGWQVYRLLGDPPRLARPLRILSAGLAGAAIVVGVRALGGDVRDGVVLVLAGVGALLAYAGGLHLLRAVPVEVRASLAALRHARQTAASG